MENYFIILFSFVILVGCNNSSSTKGVTYTNARNIRVHNEIFLPEFDDHTIVEVAENWVTISYNTGEKFIINRDKIWSITLE